MAILSTKLKMIERFNEQDFLDIVIKWLKKAGPCKAIGEQLEQNDKKFGQLFEAEFCDLQTQKISREKITYYMLKLGQEFHEQNWTTEIIYAEGDSKVVFFHIDCSGDVSLFNEAPKMRTAVIREFINSGKIVQSAINISTRPIKLGDDNVNIVAEAITGKTDIAIPIVFATQYYGSAAYPISSESLAEILAGTAHVVYSDNEFTIVLRDKLKGKVYIPFSGGIAIYSKNQRPKQYRKEDAYYGGTLDTQVINEVTRIVNAQVNKTAPSWSTLVIAEQNELLEVADGLDERAKRDAIRIDELGQENVKLKARIEYLEAALSERNSEQRLIVKSDVPEFYDGEQNDLIVSILNRELTRCADKKSRKCELLSSIVSSNAIIGNGQKMFDRIKAIFDDGETISATERAELEKMGFEITGDGKHYKLKFMGDEKFCYILAKTPGDKQRGGKNEARKIINGLSVYK